MINITDARLKRLSELADQADVIAVAGENRFLEGKYVPFASEVMHSMRYQIRAIEQEQEPA